MTARKATSYFSSLFLVYCLDRLPDGSYVALNRRYKPVGFTCTELVDYEAYPVRFKFKRSLSARQIAALSWDGNTSAERIQLYSESCDPMNGAHHLAAYFERLERLGRYQVDHGILEL